MDEIGLGQRVRPDLADGRATEALEGALHRCTIQQLFMTAVVTGMLLGKLRAPTVRCPVFESHRAVGPEPLSA
jgi:hypothetical protein